MTTAWRWPCSVKPYVSELAQRTGFGDEPVPARFHDSGKRELFKDDPESMVDLTEEEKHESKSEVARDDGLRRELLLPGKAGARESVSNPEMVAASGVRRWSSSSDAAAFAGAL